MSNLIHNTIGFGYVYPNISTYTFPPQKKNRKPPTATPNTRPPIDRDITHLRLGDQTHTKHT
jgi:hypothetical protein